MPRNARSGPAISVLISFATFLSLLQLFDPLQSSTTAHRQSAVERGLAEFKGISSQTFLHTNSTTNDANNNNTKDRILWLLQDAGVSLTSLSVKEREQLPQWQQVIDLYGDDIIVHGQERCEAFRQQHAPKDRILAVAGLFNTGTNLLNTQFARNLQGIKTLWQVPWGKHRMAQVKWEHTAHDMEQFNKEHVLPVVMVRDPLAWMQSMCANPYAAKWRHGSHHCPNLVPDDLDRQFYHHIDGNAFGVRVKYDESSHFEFDSLAHLWSEYHLQYMNADYPVLFIRYEDLVFQPKQVLTELAHCVGATVRTPLRYQINTSKNHGSGTNWIHAITKTASSTLRMNNLTLDDVSYLQQHLDPTLMNLFHYSIL